MSDESGSPVSPESVSDEQHTLSESAANQVAAFMASSADEMEAAAATARAALESAVDAHVPLPELSAALSASPDAVQALVNDDVALEDLHPTAHLD